MAANIKLEIVAPDKVFFEGEAEKLIVRATTGDMAVLYHHEPCVCLLDIGKFRLISGDEERTGAVSGGFLRVEPEKVVMIVDAAEWAEDIDLERAESAKARAEERLNKKENSDIDVMRAELALRRALNRIRVREMEI